MEKQLSENGFFKFKKIISSDWINKINTALPDIFIEHEKIRRQNNNPISSKGVAMNALVGNDLFYAFLIYLINLGLINKIEQNFFKTSCILNSFSALSNISKEDSVFHKKIHRDIRGYSGNIPIMLNMLVMLDDFTVENGGTHLYKGSHLNEFHDLIDEDFKKKLYVATGKAGDVLIWNSNLLHASGVNTTDYERRALPITFSLAYYKQLLDYPRAIGYDNIPSNMALSKLLGFNSRIPSSINEWYAPQSELLYKKD